jgi:flagellin-like hook-associated protein FlgL
VKAGNGSYTPSDRESVAIELESRLADLLGIANTADGVGGYVFSGYKSTTLPFTKTATGADYQGDQGQRSLQVGSTRTIPITDSGASVLKQRHRQRHLRDHAGPGQLHARRQRHHQRRLGQGCDPADRPPVPDRFPGGA